MRGPHFHLFDGDDIKNDELANSAGGDGAARWVVAAGVVFMALLCFWVALVIWCWSR